MRLTKIGQIFSTAAAMTIGTSVAIAEKTAEPKADGQAAFAVDLYRQLANPGAVTDIPVKPANVFFSPYSVRSALAMVGSGTDGQTAGQIDQALHRKSDESVKPLKPALDSREAKDFPGAMKLEVINALWGQVGYPFKPDFAAKLKLSYSATFETVDFAKDPEAVRKQINHWADESTHGKVKEVLPAGSVQTSTRLVLADAVYFKARWSQVFLKGNTKQEPFHVPGGPAVDVPMMHAGVEHMAYLKADGYTVIAKPYSRNSADFVMMLPDDPDGLAAAEKSLTPEQIQKWTRQMPAPELVELKLPKFTLKWDRELTPACKSMGIVDAFDPAKADFSKMAEANASEKLYIGGVFHSAFVSVDEEGTEAAAVTAVAAVGAMAMRQQPQVIHQVVADRPFLFMVVEHETGTVLFMGRVTDPR